MQVVAETVAADRPPLDRLRAMVHAFLRSGSEEAQMRGALRDCAPLYRDAPETRDGGPKGEAAFEIFVREVLPAALDATRERTRDLITTTLSTVGKEFFEDTPIRLRDRSPSGSAPSVLAHSAR